MALALGRLAERGDPGDALLRSPLLWDQSKRGCEQLQAKSVQTCRSSVAVAALLCPVAFGV